MTKLSRILALALALALITAGHASAAKAAVNRIQLQNEGVNVGAPISGNTVLNASGPLFWQRLSSTTGRLGVTLPSGSGPDVQVNAGSSDGNGTLITNWNAVDSGTAVLNFVGGTPNKQTVGSNTWANIHIPSAFRVRDEGNLLPQRDAVNFIGAGVTAADDSADNRTNVSIPGGGGGGFGPDLSREVYVGDSGSDASDCLSWQTACATVQRALDARQQLGATTTINVGKGSFNGDFEIGGSDVLRGAGRDNTLIRGSSSFNGTVIRTENGSATTVEGVRVLSDNPQFTGTLYHQEGAGGIIRDSDLRNESGRQNIAGGTYGGTALFVNSGEGNLAENLRVSAVHLAMNVGSAGNTVRKVNGGQVDKVLETEDLADCNNQPTFPDCVPNGRHSGHNSLEQSKFIEVSGPVAADVKNHGGWDFRNIDCCESSGTLWRFADGNHSPQEDGITVDQSVLSNVEVASPYGHFDHVSFGTLAVTGAHNVFDFPVTDTTASETEVLQGAVGTTIVNHRQRGAWPEAAVKHYALTDGSG